MTDEVPEADAIEQQLPAGGPPAGAPGHLDPVEPGVPVADAIEQELPAGAPLSDDEPSIPSDAPEADVIEQAQPGPLLDEEEAPGMGGA